MLLVMGTKDCEDFVAVKLTVAPDEITALAWTAVTKGVVEVMTDQHGIAMVVGTGEMAEFDEKGHD